MPTQTLKWVGNFSLEITQRFTEIRRNHHDGYDTDKTVGSNVGLLEFSLTFSSLPQSAAPAILDDETTTNMSRADYVWTFFTKRKVDGEAFNILDPRTETNVLVRFVDQEISFDLFMERMASTGLRLKQVRNGETVNETAPTGGPYRLKYLGNFNCTVTRRFAELVHSLGDGFEKAALTGHSQGQDFFILTYETLPQTQGGKILDEETSTLMFKADYVWTFFKRRKQDQQPFTITHPITRTDVLAKFDEPELTYSLFLAKFYSSGIRLRQHRT